VPLLEYECLDCGESFELLVRNSIVPACPGCESHNLNQLISMFSVSSETTRQTNLTAVRKKNAPAQRDKAIAEQEAVRNHRES
jgi:putative FmdB family regulatory protein